MYLLGKKISFEKSKLVAVLMETPLYTRLYLKYDSETFKKHGGPADKNTE